MARTMRTAIIIHRNFFILFYSFAFANLEHIYKNGPAVWQNRLLYREQLMQIHSKNGQYERHHNQQGQSNNAQQANNDGNKMDAITMAPIIMTILAELAEAAQAEEASVHAEAK